MARTEPGSKSWLTDLNYRRGWKFAEKELGGESAAVRRAALREFDKNVALDPTGPLGHAALGAIGWLRHSLEEEAG